MTMNEKWSLFDLVEGFHLSQAVVLLHEEGILTALEYPQTVEQLAYSFKLDVKILHSTLQYVTNRTMLLEEQNTKYKVTSQYNKEARFMIEQYVGAYGPNVRHLGSLLRHPSKARETVDRERHAKAFMVFEEPSLPILPDLILQLELNYLLDLGCGSGSLLLTLAESFSSFTGWGIDANPMMCRIATGRLNDSKYQGRLKIFEGNCSNLETSIPIHIRSQVETIVASSLLNEFFSTDNSLAISWLQQLRQIFPNRTLLVVDYYGQLGQTTNSVYRKILLHDFVQSISGQGIPPPNNKIWLDIYKSAGCTLVHIFEDEQSTFFIHLLRL